MKKLKLNILLVSAALMLFSSCGEGFDDMNVNPNSPEVVPTYSVFNNANRRVFDFTRDAWMSGRGTLPWVQYSAQINYLEEDKYQYRPSTAQTGWDQLYRSAANYKQIMEFASDPATANSMSAYGSLDNQIAASRVMSTYVFLLLVEHFGDVPYWSYGGQSNPDFQALQIESYMQPKYAKQPDIYADMLKELREASAQFDTGAAVFTQGDNIYGGNATQWKKLANSLRLRIANRVKDVYPQATAEMADAVAQGVFTSNADNAKHSYGNTANEGSPFWAAYFGASPRIDFAVNDRFINLLKGETGPFSTDPRLQKMAAPKGLTLPQVAAGNYTETDDLDMYQGMPYGLPANRVSANNPIAGLSFFSQRILSPNYEEVLIEYAEVEFILSEMNGWSQTNYINGIQASMEHWGVDADRIASYISTVPAANRENVLIQKYIALFMQPQEAWSEIRRTGVPGGDILLLPGATGYEIDGTPYVFVPLEAINYIPYRMRYPEKEQTLNNNNWLQGLQSLANGDNLDSKLWWIP
ncbi:MAG: SusD/RagB family nutrient-binding outer membrane lipoprotein [Weeksellaceae bacterium]|nr:SusD/RagB family nutrient-binding outer membrane lipoprotein [Weeksellaceae bacterium]